VDRSSDSPRLQVLLRGTSLMRQNGLRPAVMLVAQSSGRNTDRTDTRPPPRRRPHALSSLSTRSTASRLHRCTTTSRGTPSPFTEVGQRGDGELELLPRPDAFGLQADQGGVLARTRQLSLESSGRGAYRRQPAVFQL
jgi:hypothetical protein